MNNAAKKTGNTITQTHIRWAAGLLLALPVLAGSTLAGEALAETQQQAATRERATAQQQAQRPQVRRSTTGAQAQRTFHSGQPRPIQFIIVTEAQAGGDSLAVTSTRYCTDNSCATARESLDAGDGIGLGFGALIPLGRSKVDLEVVGGGMHRYLQHTSRGAVEQEVAFLSRYFARVSAMVNLQPNTRLGGGLVLHAGAKYKIYDEGLARKFDDAIGLRYQMEWGVGPDIFTGFYLQSMEYDTPGAAGVSANAIGFVATFSFR